MATKASSQEVTPVPALRTQRMRRGRVVVRPSLPVPGGLAGLLLPRLLL